MKKALIAGGRDMFNVPFVIQKCGLILEDEEIEEIVEGGAWGSDRCGRHYAESIKTPYKTFEANWDLYGKRAGYIRNIEMSYYCKPGDILIAFWDGISRGTKNMIDIADDRGMIIYEVPYTKSEAKDRKWYDLNKFVTKYLT